MSLRVNVSWPVLVFSLSKNSMFWRRMMRKESERRRDVSSAAELAKS